MNSSRSFIKRYTSVVSVIQRLIDPAIVSASLCFIAHLKNIEWSKSDPTVFVISFLLVVIIFGKMDLYHSWRGTFLWVELRRVIGAWIVFAGCFLFFIFFVEDSEFIRGQLFIPFAITTPLLLVFERLAIRATLRYLRSKGMNLRHAVIAGAGDLGQKVLNLIRSESNYGVDVLGFFDDRFDDGFTSIGDKSVLGNLSMLPLFVAKNSIDIVYLTLPFRAEQKMRDLVNDLKSTSVAVHLVPDIFIFDLLHTRLLDLGGIPVFSIFDTPFRGIDGWTKRAEDIILATLIMFIVAPLILAIAFCVRITSSGPVFFVQRRYGLNGEEIPVYKFRSMNVVEDGSSTPQAKRRDPRVTKFGTFLRSTSLDELPQFFNVLRGEMSIVGPRPHSVAHNVYYGSQIEGYVLRHRVKPGITGWAQINGWRGETDTLEKMEKRVQYDLEYIRNWSLWFDLKIIFLTIFRGFSGENAY